MESCEQIFEKWLALDELSPSEKDKVETHIAACSECQKRLRDYQVIVSSLKNNIGRHEVSEESLIRYSIYLLAPREPDYDGTILSPQEVTTIESHLKRCENCHDKVEQLCEEYRDIEDYLDETDFGSVSEKTPWLSKIKKAVATCTSAAAWIRRRVLAPSPKTIPFALGAVAAILVVLWMGPFFRQPNNPYYYLAYPEQNGLTLITRGATSSNLNEAFTAFSEEDYHEAALRLESFISAHSDSAFLAYAHYLLGVTYLLEAKTDFLGRFRKYDPEQIDKGVENLERCIRMTNNPGIHEDCFWYLGKAALMKSKPEEAKGIFQKIIDQQGRRFNDAKEMLLKIEQISESH